MKLFAVVSTSTSTLNKALYSLLTVISVTIPSLLAAVFPRLGAVVRYTFTADFRDRLIGLYKERLTKVDLRNRIQKLYKLRNALANKRQGTTQK
jgi:anaerobic C4-dicarboxylate transporter